MSLSFVSSAVQTGTSAGGFEETAIESKEIDAVNKRNAHKPLFEQLRTIQDDEQAKKDDAQMEIMRQTCALDDDDVAHLDSLNTRRTERERKIHERTQNEVNSFRAAKALRQQEAALLVGGNESDDDNDGEQETSVADSTGQQQEDKKKPQTTNVTTMSSFVPVIKVKKRKRRVINNDNGDNKNNNNNDTKGKTAGEKLSQTSKSKSDSNVISNENKKSEEKGREPSAVEKDSNSVDAGGTSCGGGLSSLLSGYGSSSDED